MRGRELSAPDPALRACIACPPAGFKFLVVFCLSQSRTLSSIFVAELASSLCCYALLCGLRPQNNGLPRLVHNCPKSLDGRSEKPRPDRRLGRPGPLDFAPTGAGADRPDPRPAPGAGPPRQRWGLNLNRRTGVPQTEAPTGGAPRTWQAMAGEGGRGLDLPQVPKFSAPSTAFPPPISGGLDTPNPTPNRAPMGQKRPVSRADTLPVTGRDGSVTGRKCLPVTGF